MSMINVVLSTVENVKKFITSGLFINDKMPNMVFVMLKNDKVNKFKKINPTIKSKPNAHLQTMNKMPAKFQKD